MTLFIPTMLFGHAVMIVAPDMAVTTDDQIKPWHGAPAIVLTLHLLKDQLVEIAARDGQPNISG